MKESNREAIEPTDCEDRLVPNKTENRSAKAWIDRFVGLIDRNARLDLETTKLQAIAWGRKNGTNPSNGTNNRVTTKAITGDKIAGPQLRAI